MILPFLISAWFGFRAMSAGFKSAGTWCDRFHLGSVQYNLLNVLMYSALLISYSHIIVTSLWHSDVVALRHRLANNTF